MRLRQHGLDTKGNQNGVHTDAAPTFVVGDGEHGAVTLLAVIDVVTEPGQVEPVTRESPFLHDAGPACHLAEGVRVVVVARVVL